MKLALLGITLVAAAVAQTDGNANAHYRTEQQRRDVARAMSSADRDQQQKPAELTASLGIRPGMTVADIGTGPGYMLPHFSRAVGPGGRVLAEDVFPDMLEQAKQRIEAEHLANVTTVLGTAADPKLPAGALDMAFVLEAYHHFDHPDQMLSHILPALKETGTLVIVDFYRRPGAMRGGDAMEHIRADAPQVIQEVEKNGFRLASRHDHVPDSQYVLIFRKAGADATPNPRSR